MNFKSKVFILTACLFPAVLSGQTETYSVQKTGFSSATHDEFSPVFYRNGLVFCTTRNTGLSEYSNSQNLGFTKIFYVDSIIGGKWGRSGLLSKYLKSKLNDGPATFNAAGDTIYFSRNQFTEGNLKNIPASRNKLGIFYAVREGKKWTKIREMRINNEWYNISTPYLSSDGKKIYFASDRPEGFGGSDLYYSEWKGDYWNDPVNLGPVINTPGNEAYPFINPAGELFFSSDGHPGVGGKDIFYSRMKDDEWLPPVRIDPPVNSPKDDFGIITDSLIAEGYFSSNRGKSIDIYKFKTNFPQIFYTDIQKENQYCFRFSDSGAIDVDTLYLRYAWDFGDGKKANGAVVHHCYPGPGKYDVKLDLIDRASGNVFFSKLAYSLNLKDYEQPYINSPDAVITGESIDFDAHKSFLPGYKILSYSWDFSDGGRMQGESVKYSFKQPGDVKVNLGLKLKSLSTGIIHNTGVTKSIAVFNDSGEKAAYLAKKASEKVQLPDITKYGNAFITKKYSAEEEFNQKALFRIELLSSKERPGISNRIFRNIPVKYVVKEEIAADSGIYRYYISDEQIRLMATYPAFREIAGSGFKGARINLSIITDPIEKALFDLKKNYGDLSDTYFDNFNRLTANSYLMLDQIVILMNRNPGIRLEIGVHTDNPGSATSNLTLSQSRAQLMVNYLINRGIDGKRLVGKGYGGNNPVASNVLEKDRRLNRRVDLRLIN